jgi:hypothetical protein
LNAFSLSIPQLEKDSKEIFELCASDFLRDEGLKARLCSCSLRVRDDSSLLKTSFPNNVLRIGKEPILPNNTTYDDMKKVYNDKFAKKGSVGRKYYDKIKDPGIVRCPICGVGQVRELDHYMPKSYYYTLVVTPENLIPICRDCNVKKRYYLFSEIGDVLLHPYFDGNVYEENWLTADLDFQSEMTVSYHVNCPEEWSEVLKKRVNKHFVLYRLGDSYKIEASQRISEFKSHWSNLYNRDGRDVLLEQLKSEYDSIIKNIGLNSWQAAMYYAMVYQFSKVIEWIEGGV